MRLPQRSPALAQINMTPMIDVTFLLIIFFLLSSRLAQQESLELDLPTAASHDAAANDERPRVLVHVATDGTVTFGTSVVRPQDLHGRLSVERDRAGNDVEIRIRASRDVPFRAVQPILLACAEAGIWNVTFAVFDRAGAAESNIERQTE
jgi:biopolymer transport protein ExbD